MLTFVRFQIGEQRKLLFNIINLSKKSHSKELQLKTAKNELDLYFTVFVVIFSRLNKVFLYVNTEYLKINNNAKNSENLNKIYTNLDLKNILVVFKITLLNIRYRNKN